MSIKFASALKQAHITRGEIADNDMRKFIKDALGLNKKKVESKRHTILSGPPGVGKSYGVIDECNVNQVNSLFIPAGTSDIALVTQIAYRVRQLKPNEELCIILDDADDVVFSDYQTLNKWKLAMGDVDYSIGQIPTMSHNVSLENTLKALVKSGKDYLAEAIQHFQDPGQIGVTIPMDHVRFIVLCNADLENPRGQFRGKMISAVEAVLDRFKYKRISLNWEHEWGWLAYVLGKSQPFPDYPLTDQQKKELLDWMYSNWSSLRSTSYRTVKELAEAMINEPDDYEDIWTNNLRGH